MSGEPGKNVMVLLSIPLNKLPWFGGFVILPNSSQSSSQPPPDPKYNYKFFITSTEFNKNTSDWSHDYTDHKNGMDLLNGQK